MCYCDSVKLKKNKNKDKLIMRYCDSVKLKKSTTIYGI